MGDPLAEEYKSATVTVDGTTVRNAGFRTKGNLTLRSVAGSDSNRFSFRIKLDEYVKGQNILGLDEFVINNMYSDPSYLREYLSYEALEEIGAEVPASVFANIYINGKLHGFYLCVEAIDDSYLERNFGDHGGNLYKQEQGSTLQYAQGSSYDRSEQKSGKDESKTDLKNFIKILNEMPQGQKGEIENVLDVDSALRNIAANTVLGNYDSYSGNMAQNYYLYGQDGKFTVLPWDYNMSMAGFGGGDLTTIPIDEPVMGVNIQNLPLIQNLLEVEEYKGKYHGYLKDLLNYLEGFETRVADLANIIRPYVEADPTKFITMEQFEANIKYSEVSAPSQTDAVSQTDGAKQTDGANQGNGSNTVNQENTANIPDLANPAADVITGASQNAGGNQPNGGQRQIPPDMAAGQLPQNLPEGLPPQDMQGGQPPQNIPGRFEKGNRQALPGGMGGNMKGGPNGGMGMGGSTSIVNYIRDRVENIKKQLAGELPTTGNTTMNNMRGGNRPVQ